MRLIHVIFVPLEKILNRLPLFRQNDLRMRRAAAGRRVVERAVLRGNIAAAQFRRGLAHADELRVVKDASPAAARVPEISDLVSEVLLSHVIGASGPPPPGPPLPKQIAHRKRMSQPFVQVRQIMPPARRDWCIARRSGISPASPDQSS